VQEEVKQLIGAASEQPNRPLGSDAQKVGDYYLAYMDTTRIETLGVAPLNDEFAHIDAIATPRDLARYIGRSQRLAVGQPFKWFSSPDKDNSTVYVGVLYQNGLTMPDRDYSLSPDAKYATFRAKLAEYIEQMLACAGVREANSAALRIVALETRIANNQWTKVQNRDPVQTHNPMTLPDYQKLIFATRFATRLLHVGSKALRGNCGRRAGIELPASPSCMRSNRLRVNLV
jgi:putative endopeptidase